MNTQFKDAIKAWKEGAIDYIDNRINNDSFYTSAEYYPEEDVTIYCRNIFEGHYFDDNIEVFYGLCKGRGNVEELFEDIEDDEEDEYEED